MTSNGIASSTDDQLLKEINKDCESEQEEISIEAEEYTEKDSE
jgi:hypothetical protein